MCFQGGARGVCWWVLKCKHPLKCVPHSSQPEPAPGSDPLSALVSSCSPPPPFGMAVFYFLRYSGLDSIWWRLLSCQLPCWLKSPLPHFSFCLYLSELFTCPIATLALSLVLEQAKCTTPWGLWACCDCRLCSCAMSSMAGTPSIEGRCSPGASLWLAPPTLSVDPTASWYLFLLRALVSVAALVLGLVLPGTWRYSIKTSENWIRDKEVVK